LNKFRGSIDCCPYNDDDDDDEDEDNNNKED
jgi:hypothetical protein